jgi:hypothetical protein
VAYKRITLNDIGQWQSEVRTCFTGFTGTCNGNLGCNVLDLNSLSKTVFEMLKELNLTFVGLCGKGGGLREWPFCLNPLLLFYLPIFLRIPHGSLPEIKD